MKKSKGRYYSGTSNLVLPIPQKHFPEPFTDKSRLTYYASLHNSVEINSSFYKLPMAKTVEKWAASVPDGFKFTLKFSKEITHSKGLEYEPEAVERFMKVAEGAGDKKGCLLIQFPASITADNTERVEELLSLVRELDTGHTWSIAVEFRHRSWYHRHTYAMLQAQNAVLVLHDMERSETELISPKGDVAYLRFHGTEKGYRGSYDHTSLQEYARFINEHQDKGKTVYVYFNNTLGAVLENLETLDKLVGP